MRDVLNSLANLEPVEPEPAVYGAGAIQLGDMLEARCANADESLRRYAKGEIEDVPAGALKRLGIHDGQRDYEIQNEEGRLVTVSDFAWPDLKVAVFCAGYAYDGNPEILELDAKKRNFLQARGWIVLTFWGRTLLKDADGCAQEVLRVLRSRRKS